MVVSLPTHNTNRYCQYLLLYQKSSAWVVCRRRYGNFNLLRPGGFYNDPNYSKIILNYSKIILNYSKIVLNYFRIPSNTDIFQKNPTKL